MIGHLPTSTRTRRLIPHPPEFPSISIFLVWNHFYTVSIFVIEAFLDSGIRTTDVKSHYPLKRNSSLIVVYYRRMTSVGVQAGGKHLSELPMLINTAMEHTARMSAPIFFLGNKVWLICMIILAVQPVVLNMVLRR